MSTVVGTVFVDLDDTLWENNRFFVRVLDAWGDLLAGLGVDRDRALEVLERCEDRNIPLTGYGARPFLGSVLEACGLLLPSAPTEVQNRFHQFARDAERAIRDHPIELLPGVAQGLADLARTRRLVALTKGQPDEQRAKLARSGLERHFAGCRVVREKEAGVYATACRSEGAPPAACWMVGNSPRSDINPARRAGLRTVLVAHDAPWHRDLAELVNEGPPTLEAASFADVPALIGESD
jgi:putative hydrolase of the HAD superfamily